MPNNIKLYYSLHQRLDLQSTRSILFALDHPRLMYPYKWQQIEYRVFEPLLRSPYEGVEENKDSEEGRGRANGKFNGAKRSSIFNTTVQPRRLTLQSQLQPRSKK